MVEANGIDVHIHGGGKYIGMIRMRCYESSYSGLKIPILFHRYL